MREHLRWAILERDDYTCGYCGFRTAEMQYKNGRYRRATLHVDHIVPISKGGTNHPCNLVTACESCNLKKGPRLWRAPWALCVACNTRWAGAYPGRTKLTADGPRFECSECLDLRLNLDLGDQAIIVDEIDLEIESWDRLAAA